MTLRNLTRYLFLLSLILIAGCSTAPMRKEGSLLPQEGGIQAEKVSLLSSEYTLGPGDVIEVDVWKNDDLKKIISIDISGKISYPLIGELEVSGLTIFQVRKRIIENLSKFLVDPQVTVSIKGYGSQKVFILGEVIKPGLLFIEGSMNAVEAVSRAGGFTDDAKEKNVLLVRPHPKSTELRILNLKDTLRKGDISQNINLQKGDIIYVPATYIAYTDKFFRHIYNILSPIVLLEMGIVLEPSVVNVLKSGETKQPAIIQPIIRP